MSFLMSVCTQQIRPAYTMPMIERTAISGWYSMAAAGAKGIAKR